MDHISQIVNKDPTEVRMANMPIFGSKRNLKRYINELRIWAKIEQRQAEIEAFNLNNRWMKRGLYITTTTFKLWPLAYWPVIVSIYHLDGTVAISHGGIELGQGINTKVILSIKKFINCYKVNFIGDTNVCLHLRNTQRKGVC